MIKGQPYEISLSRDVTITDIEKAIQSRWWKKSHFEIEMPKTQFTYIRGFTVFIVDGEWIRNNLDVTFGTGGHGLVHSFIPMDEIWIDPANESEKSLMFHEIYEFELMKTGMNYWNAHQKTIEDSKGLSQDDKLKRLKWQLIKTG